MYKYIKDPLTLKKISINSKYGKIIIKKYINTLKGGNINEKLKYKIGKLRRKCSRPIRNNYYYSKGKKIDNQNYQLIGPRQYEDACWLHTAFITFFFTDFGYILNLPKLLDQNILKYIPPKIKKSSYKDYYLGIIIILRQMAYNSLEGYDERPTYDIRDILGHFTCKDLKERNLISDESQSKSGLSDEDRPLAYSILGFPLIALSLFSQIIYFITENEKNKLLLFNGLNYSDEIEELLYIKDDLDDEIEINIIKEKIFNKVKRDYEFNLEKLFFKEDKPNVLICLEGILSSDIPVPEILNVETESYILGSVIFVSGGHITCGITCNGEEYLYDNESYGRFEGKNWKTIWKEKWNPINIKTSKSYLAKSSIYEIVRILVYWNAKTINKILLKDRFKTSIKGDFSQIVDSVMTKQIDFEPKNLDVIENLKEKSSQDLKRESPPHNPSQNDDVKWMEHPVLGKVSTNFFSESDEKPAPNQSPRDDEVKWMEHPILGKVPTNFFSESDEESP